MRVVLLHDRLSEASREDERDVLVQMDAVEAVLHAAGHQCRRVAFTLNLALVAESLRAERADLVFNLVESVEGQGRLIHLAPALLESLHMPYTGAHTEAMVLTSTKVLGKRFMRLNGIPTPDWYTLAELQGGVPKSWHEGRFIVKSVWEEASVGLDDDSIVVTDDPGELCEAIAARAGRLGGEGFAEAFVEGREFNLALIGDGAGCEVLPPAEIVFDDWEGNKPRIVGYRAKWIDESLEYRNTRRSFEFQSDDQALLAELTRIAQGCWQTFGLRGYARVDFRVDESGAPLVLEINANPCLSPDAGFAAAAARGGMSYAGAVGRIVQAAMAGQ